MNRAERRKDKYRKIHSRKKILEAVGINKPKFDGMLGNNDETGNHIYKDKFQDPVPARDRRKQEDMDQQQEGFE